MLIPDRKFAHQRVCPLRFVKCDDSVHSVCVCVCVCVCVRACVKVERSARAMALQVIYDEVGAVWLS